MGERKKGVATFPSHSFKRVCQVRMGEPDDDFKAGVLDQILNTKKAKAEKDAQRKRAERDRKKAEELNLDANSPNANTISMFSGGVRCCQPQSLPESLKGKTLYPVVCFKNVALQVHFGPEP